MKRIFVIALMGLSTMAVSAKGVGSQWLRQVAVYNDSLFGVSTAVPTGFVGGADGLSLMEYAPNDTWGNSLTGNRGRYLYCATALSKDRECMILYPYLIFARSKVDTTSDRAFALSQKQMGAEMEVALAQTGGSQASQPATAVARMGGAEALQWGHADSVYVVEFPVAQPCLGRFTHCVAVYMAKSKRPPIFLKVLLTDKGYARRDAFLAAARECMAYQDRPMLAEQKSALPTNALLNIRKAPIIMLRHGTPQP